MVRLASPASRMSTAEGQSNDGDEKEYSPAKGLYSQRE